MDRSEEYLDGIEEAGKIARKHLQEIGELDVSEEEDVKKGRLRHKRTSERLGARKERREERERKKREAVNEALNQKYLDLNEEIGTENKRMLIALLTQGFTDNIDRYKSYIDHTIEKALRKFIPPNVLNTWQRFPETMVPLTGFTYECSGDYGGKHRYFVQLDLPMFIHPEACQELFREHNMVKVPRLEKTIELFYYHRDCRTATQVKYAKILAGLTTYYQLLKQKPYWYFVLVEYLKAKNGWTYQ